jgi:hypothetical protein
VYVGAVNGIHYPHKHWLIGGMEANDGRR